MLKRFVTMLSRIAVFDVLNDTVLALAFTRGDIFTVTSHAGSDFLSLANWEIFAYSTTQINVFIGIFDLRHFANLGTFLAMNTSL